MEDGNTHPGFFSKIFKKKEENAEEEIVSILNEGQGQGTILESEAEMIANIFELDDIEASQIMTHRKNVSAVDGDLSLKEAVEYICNENYSRFPVYEGTVDNIIGILHIKDAIKLFLIDENHSKRIKDIEGLLRKAHFIPETSKIDNIFRNMQSENSHLEIVVDEYGQTAGIVAMEDILEKIVGNIFDEHDEVEINITGISDNEYEIKGLTPLSEVEEVCGISFNDQDNDTLNGFLVSKMDRIPDNDEGTVIEYGNIKFEIIKVEDKTISKVRMVLSGQLENNDN